MATTTTEAKTNGKPTETKPDVVDENSSQPPLKYKTWVLKVSIHCEGCKKKVKKTLQNIEGVYETNIDLRQQRVTVTGNVEAETLIKNLVKTRRHAELWPDHHHSKEKKKSGKNKGKQSENPPENSHDHENDHNPNQETVKVEVLQVKDPSKTHENANNNNSGTSSAHEGGGQPGKQHGPGGQVKAPKAEVKQTVTVYPGIQSPPAEKNELPAVGAAGGVSGGGGGGGGKKKKKKGQKDNNTSGNEGEHNIGPCHAPASSGSQIYAPATNQGMPFHQEHQFPQPYFSNHHYSTAHPSGGYSASYYASPPPNYSYSYRYVHRGVVVETEPPPYDVEPYSSSQPTDSFELLSEENPNGCSVM